MSRLRQFWMDGWGIVREYGNIAVVIGDAFASPPDWNGFMTSWSNVILDTHQYQVFSAGQVAMGIDAHVASACGIGRMMRQTDKPTVCGEWTGALSMSPFPGFEFTADSLQPTAPSGSTVSAAACAMTARSMAHPRLEAARAAFRARLRSSPKPRGGILGASSRHSWMRMSTLPGGSSGRGRRRGRPSGRCGI